MSGFAVTLLRTAPIALLAACVTDPQQTFAADSPNAPRVALRDIDYSGDQDALATLDREITVAGHDIGAISALTSRLVALLHAGETSTAARQAICQRLGLLYSVVPPDAAALATFGAMLVAESESDFARLALEPATGPAVDQLLLNSVAKASGGARLGLIQTLARRAPAAAVPALAPLLRDSDPQTAAAVAYALGRIGCAAALAELRAAPPSSAVFAATLACVDRLPPSEFQSLLRDLVADSRLSPTERAAAIRKQLEHDPVGAGGRIAELLASPETELRSVALEQIGIGSGQGLTSGLADALPALEPSTQASALTALARRADSEATPLILASTRHRDSSVRAAAITALGSQPGSPELVALLGRLALAADGDDARLARVALTRLHGPGLTDAILAAAETGLPASRAVFIEQVAARHIPEGLPLVRRCRDEPDSSVRLAALAALGEIAPPSDQALLIAWTLAARSEEERTRALRSLASVTQRNPDAIARARPVFAMLEQASPATAISLLPILLRLGGRESAECAARLALARDPNLAARALATLTRWPDASAQASLAFVAESTASADQRATAVEAALVYHERNREPWLAADTARVARLLKLAADPLVRTRIVSLLRRAADPAAVVLAQKLQAEPSCAEEARIASEFIAANLAGPPEVRVSKNEESASRIVDGSTATCWAAVLTPDLWLEFDFKRPRPMQRITLDQTGRATEYPERLEIYVTEDPRNPGPPLATGGGQRGRTVVDLPPNTRGRYLIVKNTAERLSAMWSICELFID